MTVQNPSYLQVKAYTARQDRQLLSDFFKPGVRDIGVVDATTGRPLSGDLLVSPSGGTRGLNIARGVGYIAGTNKVDQGTYRFFNDATITATLDAASTYPRIDQIVMRVYDSTENDDNGPDQAVIEIVKGVEANGATLVNRSGAVPDNAMPVNVVRLADVLVTVGIANIPAANIQDRRPAAGLKPGGTPPVGTCVPYTQSGEPTDGYWTMADGKLIDRLVYTEFFSGKDGSGGTGHAYNGGVDPGNFKVRVPDKRGKTSFGATNMGTVQGSADASATNNLIAQIIRGVRGGEKNHLLTTSEVPSLSGSGSGSAGPTVVSFEERAYAGGGSTGVMGISGTGSTGYLPVGVSVTVNGGGGVHNNIPPNEGDNWIVRIA